METKRSPVPFTPNPVLSSGQPSATPAASSLWGMTGHVPCDLPLTGHRRTFLIPTQVLSSTNTCQSVSLILEIVFLQKAKGWDPLFLVILFRLPDVSSSGLVGIAPSTLAHAAILHQARWLLAPPSPGHFISLCPHGGDL